MKTIWLNPFSEESIENCIKELEDYKNSLTPKCMKMIDFMCKDGSEHARIRWAGHFWSGATYDSVIGYREGNIGIISVGGNAIWVEFGTGVYAKGQTGYPTELPAGIVPLGTYGDGKGSDPNGWTYYDEFTGDYYHTKGHPSDPIMWETAQKLQNEVAKYAREAFNGTV